MNAVSKMPMDCQELIAYCARVSNPSNQLNSETSEKLWKFLGIPGAYDPSKRKNYVGYTASMQQVSKDIYDTSIGKNGFNEQKSMFFDDLEKQRQYWKSQLN